MSIVQHAIETSIQGVRTVVCPFAFQAEQGRVLLLPGHFHPVAEKDIPLPGLSNCMVGWVENAAIIRSGILDSPHKIDQFLALANGVQRELKAKLHQDFPLRISANQINSVETEWDLIIGQHQYLIEAGFRRAGNASLLHLSTSIDAFFFPHPPRQKLRRELETLKELPKLLNMEAWASYCLWYNEILELAFSRFHYDAVDEYTIEKYIKDFRHEVYNHYLHSAKEHLLHVELAMGTKESGKKISYREFLKFEKDAIVARKDIQRMMRAHFEILKEINRIIPIIEEAHPELIAVKVIGSLLQKLLEFEVDEKNLEELQFVNKQMLLQLFNEQLGVISAINCDTGVDRTNIAFAVRLATLQLKRLTSSANAADLAVHWNETVNAVTHCLAKRGGAHLEEWITNLDDSHFQARVKNLLLFWELITKNLNRICKPITEWNLSGRKTEAKTGMHLNREYLRILPPIIRTRKVGSHPIETIVRYDPETLEPRELTDAGQHFLIENSLANFN